MNKPKRSLRSAFEELAARFADAVLAAAREELRELAPPRPRAAPRRERRTVAKVPSRAKRAIPARVDREPPASHAASDLLITDPQALLAALDTATPTAGWEELDPPAPREEPAILRPVQAVVPTATFAPVLREGEVVVRRSAGGVVLRRRRA